LKQYITSSHFSVLEQFIVFIYRVRQNIKTRQAKVGRLLDMLARRGGRAFNRLIEAIKLTEQDNLIEGLCPRTKNIQDPESINEIIHLIGMLYVII